MKNLILLWVFAFLSTNCTAQKAKKDEKAVIQSVFNCDHCKICETCGKNFQANLYAVKGLKMYELDEKKMTITVYYDSKKTDLQTIKTAITKLGYDADEMKADVAAYERLDGCCKKV